MADNSTILLSSNDKGDETRVDLGVLEVILGIAARKSMASAKCVGR